MRIEILIATMDQIDFSLIEAMNVQTDAIVVNQCDHYAFHKLQYKGFVIKWFNVKERGLSRSRNVAFSKATGDVCLLVDDDEILKDNYGKFIIKEFENNSDADLITFNLNSIGNVSHRYMNKKRRRLHFFNIMRYGSARIAFRRKKIEDLRISFAPNFGAGTEISSGEDSLFLNDCLRGGLHAYSSPVIIADINDDEGTSSWFKGYTEKYFINMGSIFAAMSPKFSELWILQFLIRHRKIMNTFGFWKCIRLMHDGKRKFKNGNCKKV